MSFERGGYPLSGDPAKGRVMHTGAEHPRCRECGFVIFGDEDCLPNTCPLTVDHRHVYPDGTLAPMSPAQRLRLN